MTRASLLLIAPLCVIGAIIGVQLIVTLGITANTSLIGALAGMVLARIPLAAFRRYRSVHMQNLAQSAISAATFGAGNALMLPIGIPFVMGRPDLVLPLFVGVTLAMLTDGYLLYRMFDSEVFPATGAWPPGAAAAEAIRAGDEGGRKAVVLGVGVVLGIAGNWLAAIPMSAFGVAFIGNIWALTMFGIGLLLRGYSALLFNHPVFAWIIPKGDINAAYIPHGMMVGAGIVALVQVAVLILRRGGVHIGGGHTGSVGTTRSTTEVRRALGLGVGAYVAIAVVIALFGGLLGALSWPMLLLFLVYAAFAALVHELIVGLAAMHSGWFPAFAVALITLVIGMLIGFPPVALALLVGFSVGDRAGVLRHGLRFEGRLYAAWLRHRSRLRNGRPAPATDRRDVCLCRCGRSGAVGLSQLLCAQPGGAGRSGLRRHHQCRRLFKGGARIADLGDPRGDYPGAGRAEAPAWRAAVDRAADRLSDRRMGGAGGSGLPRGVGAVGEGRRDRNDADLWRGRDRRGCAVCVLQLDGAEFRRAALMAGWLGRGGRGGLDGVAC